MADTDNIKDGKEFGIGIPPARQAFFLKGMDNADWGLKDRMARIFNKTSGNTVMLAFDHGYIMGPTSGLERMDLSIVPLIPWADCLMCTRGALRSLVPPDAGKPVCLRSSAGSTILTELNDECILDIQDILRVNASAAAVMVSIGGKFEALTIRNLTTMCDLGFRYGVPVMGVTAVGKEMTRDARYFSMASRVCAENGASIVKTYFCEGFEKVAACCPVPIVIAGGKKVPEAEALDFAYQAIQSGASGVDMGRNVFQSDAPAAMIQAIRSVVHEGTKPKDAFDLFNTLKNQK